jgi:hypothetical protein
MSSVTRSFAQKLPRVGTYLTGPDIGTPSFTYPKAQGSVTTVGPTGIVPPRIQGGKLYTRNGKMVHVYDINLENKKGFVYSSVRAVDGTNLGEDATKDAYINSWSSFNSFNETNKFYLTG